MPFYEYQCAACGHHHEELQKVSDRALRKCPACSRPSLKRLVSAPVFRLKGGGWYETDFKHDKEAKRNIAGDKEPAAGEGPAVEKPKDEKADAKPADKKPEAAPAAKASPPARKPKPARPKAARRRPVRR
ncbi:MAG: zinc ribbon domain-containing protein [Gammaproteobacteria bacterium]|nr:zinc ribbon domain-containing protein [Gammaproteobacteria bacterium]